MRLGAGRSRSRCATGAIASSRVADGLVSDRVQCDGQSVVGGGSHVGAQFVRLPEPYAALPRAAAPSGHRGSQVSSESCAAVSLPHGAERCCRSLSDLPGAETYGALVAAVEEQLQRRCRCCGRSWGYLREVTGAAAQCLAPDPHSVDSDGQPAVLSSPYVQSVELRGDRGIGHPHDALPQKPLPVTFGAQQPAVLSCAGQRGAAGCFGEVDG
jgi:hypothetical protein